MEKLQFTSLSHILRETRYLSDLRAMCREILKDDLPGSLHIRRVKTKGSDVASEEGGFRNLYSVRRRDEEGRCTEIALKPGEKELLSRYILKYCAAKMQKPTEEALYTLRHFTACYDPNSTESRLEAFYDLFGGLTPTEFLSRGRVLENAYRETTASRLCLHPLSDAVSHENGTASFQHITAAHLLEELHIPYFYLEENSENKKRGRVSSAAYNTPPFRMVSPVTLDVCYLDFLPDPSLEKPRSDEYRKINDYISLGYKPGQNLILLPLPAQPPCPANLKEFCRRTLSSLLLSQPI